MSVSSALFTIPLILLFSSKLFVNSQVTLPIDTGVTLAVFNETLPSANFSCGANRFQEQVGHLFNSTQCRNLRDPMNVCCETHDSCYNNQTGKINCDNMFCECLSLATEKNLCAIDASGLCTAARLFGQDVYDIAGGVKDVSPTIN